METVIEAGHGSDMARVGVPVARNSGGLNALLCIEAGLVAVAAAVAGADALERDRERWMSGLSSPLDIDTGVPRDEEPTVLPLLTLLNRLLLPLILTLGDVALHRGLVLSILGVCVACVIVIICANGLGVVLRPSLLHP